METRPIYSTIWNTNQSMKQVWRYMRQRRHQLQVDLGVRGKFTPRQKLPAHLLIAFLMISKVNDGTNWRKQWRFVWKKICCHSKLLKIKDWSEWSINWTQDTTCLQGSTLLKKPCQQCMKSAVVGYKQHCHCEWLEAVSLRMEFRWGETGMPNNGQRGQYSKSSHSKHVDNTVLLWPLSTHCYW